MENSNMHQALTLNDRSQLAVNGVSHVVAFDAEYICIETNLGRLTVEGQNLIIDNLSKENQEISVRGEIDGIFYTSVKNRQKGMFARFLK